MIEPREWHCYYSPEEQELKSGYNFGCTDDWEWVHVIEHTAFMKVCEERDELREAFELKRKAYSLLHEACLDFQVQRNRYREALARLSDVAWVQDDPTRAAEFAAEALKDKI
jgi:hypothetical protein